MNKLIREAKPMLVAFGPREESYLIQNRDNWVFKAPNNSKLDKFLQKIQKQNATIYTVSFGEGGSWYMAYEYTSLDGKQSQRHKGEAIRMNYPELDNWLVRLGGSWNAKDVWVSLGPRGSYWARHKTRGTSHHKLPEYLAMQLSTTDEGMAKVTLGWGNSFVWWNGQGGYGSSRDGPVGEWIEDELKKKYDPEDGVGIVSAALSPSHQDLHFVLSSDIASIWRTPFRMDSGLEDLVKKYKASAPPNLVTGINAESYGPTRK